MSELAFSNMLSALNKNKLKLFHETSIKELKSVSRVKGTTKTVRVLWD